MDQDEVLSRSCFNLSNVEPCVNKAIAHLDTLKKQLSEKPAQSASVVLSESPVKVHPPDHSRNTTPKPILVIRGGDATSSPHSSKLIIEGVATGIPVGKETQVKKQVTRMHYIVLSDQVNF